MPNWQWVRPTAIMLVATFIFMGLAVSVRNSSGDNQQLANVQVGLDPYVTGAALQQAILPLALLFLFSSTAVFQRVVSAKPHRQDRFWMAMSFVLIQILFVTYQWWLNALGIGGPTFGLLVVLAAGLLLGRRAGLAVGLISFFLSGTYDWLWAVRDWMVLSDTTWWELLQWWYVFNLSSVALLWTGVMADQLHDVLDNRDLSPGWGFIIGAAVEGIATLFAFIGWNDSGSISRIIPAMLVSGVSLAIFVLIGRSVRGSAAQRQAETAELALAQAELRALRAQINPHFLFNSLNTIRYFVRTDPEKARELLLHLSEVFQNALKSGEFVTLQQEIDFTKAYLSLEQARLDERLNISWFIQNDQLLECEIPALLLQPIVENAIIHGIAPKQDGGKLQINISQGNGRLVLQVIDSGLGMTAERRRAIAEATTPTEGSIGVFNIRGRLRALYDNQANFRVESTPGHGTTVEVRIPMNSG